MLECLKKQKDCYAQLLEIAQRQQKAIDEKSDPDLLQALKDKNPILQTLQTLDEELKPALNSMSETDRQLMIQEGQIVKDEIAQTLEQLIEIEDACTNFLKDKKQDIFEQIKVLQERKKGLKGYGQSGGKSSSFSQEG